MLRTRCIYSEPKKEDGVRISVMSRHTQNDGKTPDPRIVEGVSYVEHRPDLGAPGWLVAWWHFGNELGGARKSVRWAAFESDYKNYLRNSEVAGKVAALARRALNEDVTILCKEEKPLYCHRSILAEACASAEPELRIRHVI